MSNVQIAPPVTAGDRISDVLARDESLVNVFVRHAPHFEKLRDREMRRVMARLVTVEEAAQTANVATERLVRDLNEALGLTVGAIATAHVEAVSPAARPEAPSRPLAANVVELDVRDDLRLGREPFSRILSTVSGLRDTDVLHLRATFEPVPLFGVLAKRGFVHESRTHAADDWSVWFWRPDDGTRTWLDVRGLNPPEPMMRTLIALDQLVPGHELVQVNSRVPQFLFPVLAERGFACEVDESQSDRVLVRIWHAR